MSATKNQPVSNRKSLELAIKRIQADIPKVVPKGTKLSIASVAKEASLSNSTIHNRYPDIADSIRKIVSDSYGKQLGVQRGKLKECLEKLARLRKENEALKTSLARSQSINLRLLKESELLRNMSQALSLPNAALADV